MADTDLIGSIQRNTELLAQLDPQGDSGNWELIVKKLLTESSSLNEMFTTVTSGVSTFLGSAPVFVNDSFQGIRFYDGTRFGYLRINPDKVELLVSEALEYELDGTKTHSYRITAKGSDIKLYVDNVLAINGTGKFTQKTDHRLIEFGDISGRGQSKGSAWKNFRYNVNGDNAPGSNENMVTEEVLSVPDGSFGSASSYSNALYASFDPVDDSASSSIYRYKEGSTPEILPTKPVTKSSVNAVKIDPNKQTDVFGTSGKFIATDFGLQYVLGSKLSDLPLEADMSSPPEDGGWSILANCEGTCHNLNGGILTIDTRNESETVYFDYRDGGDSEWVSTAKNEKGWTVETVVRVADDGTSGLPTSHDEAYFEALAATEGKDVVIAVERSSIMQPNEKRNAVRLVSYLLRQLNRWDKFNVVLYGQFDNRYPVGSPAINNLCASLTTDFVEASGTNIDLAIDFVKTIDSNVAYGLYPDVRAATEKSLSMSYSSPNKYLILVGSGFSYIGPFPAPNASLNYGTQPTDLTELSYNVIPSAIGHSVVKDTYDQNTSTYDAKIITVGLGEFLDSPALVLPSDVAYMPATVYQTMWSELASDSNGRTYRIKSIDDPDVTAKSIALFMDPNANNDSSTSSSITPLQASIASGDGCSVVIDTSSGTEPASDGITCPGIVINDGTYQEIVQLFQRGVRLKYAKLFAPLSLSTKYYRLRIVGRKQAIAVYAKAEGDKDWERILFSPYGLYVKAQEISDVDSPMVARDAFGVKHAVWQETINGTWGIFYARTTPETILCSGVVNDPKSKYLTDIIANRVSFGLSTVGAFDPAKITNSVVSGTGKFVTSGVKPGDVISMFNFMRADGAPLLKSPVSYTVKEVADDIVLSLDTAAQIYYDDPELRWDTAEYVVHRGIYKFGTKVKLSTQTLDSSSPYVFSHSSGDVYVAYENIDKGSSDIYVRRATSNPSFTAWEDTLRLTRGSGMSHSPSIAEISDGKLIVAWEESSADGSRSQILYAFIDPDKFTDKVPLRVADESSVRARNAKVISAAVDADDKDIRDAVIFWEDDLGGQSGNIYAAKISAKSDKTYGTVTYGPLKLTISDDNRNPVVSSANDDYLWMTWRKVVGTKGQIWAAKVSFANLLVTDESLLSIPVGNCSKPSISQDAQQNVYVCYADDRYREGRTDVFVSTYQETPVIGPESPEPEPEPEPEPGPVVHGLDAQYFSGVTLSSLALSRIDQTVNFWWANTMPWPSTRRGPFSARWTGFVEAQFTEPYTFCTVTDDGARLWVNGVLIQNHWWKHGPVEICSSPVNLVAGQKYSIVLEFFENGRGRAATQLLWKSPSTPKQIIPATALYPASVPVTPPPPPVPVVPPPPTPPNELATPRVGQWVSSAQFGMDIRLMPRDNHDSFDVPSVVAEENTSVPRFFVVCRASNTGSDTSILGAYVDVAPIDGDPPLKAILTCEDNNATQPVTNLVHFLNRATNNAYASVNTSELHGTDPSHGFYDIDLGNKSYFHLKTENISFPKIVPEAGCLDLWFKPQWDSTDASVRQLFGNAGYNSTDANSFSLAYVPNGFQLRIVDSGGYVRSTTISSAEFSWAVNDPIRIRAKWIPTATGMSKINSVCFKDANNGIACGAEGSIFKTTDGGLNWTKIDVHITYDFYCVDYVNTGIAVISGEMGTILSSVDDGASWTTIDTNLEHDLKSVYYDLVDLKVYAVSNNGEVLSSSDLVTWATVWTAPTGLLTVSTMSDPLGRSILVGGTNGKIYKSTDGATFTDTTTPAQASTLGVSSISREHYNTGYTTFACGDGGLVLRTDDSGDTWTQIDVDYEGLEPALYSISRVDDGSNTWFAVGSDGTMVSGVESVASICSTALINGSFMTVDAQFGSAPGTKVLAAGSGSAYLISDDSGVHQTYYTISSRNLTLTINGQEYAQTRVGDAPFSWDPTAKYWYVADIATSATDSDFKLYQLTLCDAPVLNERALLRKETWTVSVYNGLAAVLASGYMPLSLVGKRLEWGSLTSKSRTHWKYFGAYPCASKVPQKFYAWNTQLGLAGELVNDLATDSLGRLFVATGNGLSVMNTSEVSTDIERWENRLGMPYNSKSRLVNVTNLLYNLPEGQINSVTVDDDQDVWFGTPSGLCLLPIGSISEAEQTQTDPLQAIIDEYQNRLTGQTAGVESQQTTSGGNNVRKYEKVTVITTSNGLPSNNINVVKAVGNKVFVGTDVGLSVINKEATITSTVATSTQVKSNATGTTVTGTSTSTNKSTGTTSTSISTTSIPAPAPAPTPAPATTPTFPALTPITFNTATRAVTTNGTEAATETETGTAATNVTATVPETTTATTTEAATTTKATSATETSTKTPEQTKTSTTLNYTVKNYTVVDGLPSNRIQSIGYNPVTEEVWIGTDYGCVRAQITKEKIEISKTVTVANTMSITPWQGGMLLGTSFGLLYFNGSLAESQVGSEVVGLSPIVCGDVDASNVSWLGSALGLVELNNECGTNAGLITSSVDGLLGFDTLIDFKYYKLVSPSLPVGGCEKALVFPQVNGKRITSGYKIIPQVPMIEFETPLRSTDSVEAFVHKGFRRLPSLINTEVYPLAYLETEKLRMNLYRKRVLAGTVLVGGNMGPGTNGTPRMYTVLAQPIDPSGAPLGDNWPVTAVSGPDTVEFRRPVEEGQSIYVGSSELVQTIPTEAYNAQLIAFPATDNESNLDQYATLTVAVDSIIYVAYDSKALDIPSWLRSFDPVSTVQRVSDMEVYTPPGSVEKLYVATRGSNGCLYSVLQDESACDVMAETAMDNSGPDGCITNAVMTGTDMMRLSLTADDPISGVADMKVSARADFKNDAGEDLPWVPFAGTYEIQVPITQSTSATVVSTITTGTYGNFYTWNGQSLATTSDTGRVYKIIPGADPELLFDTGQPDITSLVSFGKYLVVGTGPNGLIYTWDGTTLKPLTVPNATRITAMTPFDNLLFLGVTYVNNDDLPTAYIYTISETDLDAGNFPSLFKSTLETDITGFAIFGGMLYWSSSNERIHAEGSEVVEDFVTLATTTTRGHKHSFSVPAGVKLMSDLNGYTTEVDGHSHQIISGVVQAADSHSHVLNGVMSGKVFRLDAVTGNVIIVHADRDYKVTTISSSSLDDQGIMFIGTYPNGKILRYVPTEEIFSKSFDTPADRVNRLKYLEGKTYAVAGNDFFVFNGFRWEFLGSTGGADIIDILANPSEVFLLTSTSVYSVATTVTTTTSTTQPAWRACAYVTFRDNLGNESDRYESDGSLKSCYYVCATDQGFSGASGFSGSSGGSGGGTNGGGTSGAIQIVHRITEVNENALSVRSLVGPNAFFSANLVQNEVGVYESEIFNGTTSFVQWVSISWDSTVPMGTSLDLQVRSASTFSGVSSATWSDLMTTPSGGTRPEYDITNQRGQFMQFKATLKCTTAGVSSPELQAVFIKLRTSQAVHYYTTNFALPQELKSGILTYNGCKYPPTTDLVFGINAQDSTDFSDYQVIEPNKVFEALPEHQRKNLRVGIKLISDTTTVPVVDEFALLFSLANDAIIRLNLPGMPVDGGSSIVTQGQTKSVLTDVAQGHAHTVTYDAYLDTKDQVNGQTSINAGHSHKIVSGVIQPAAGHSHDFTFE